jgi:signal peptidase I
MIRHRNIMRKTGQVLLNVFYYSSIVVFSILLLRIFVVGSYRIPTDSMEPGIVPGDYILVNKLAYGARLFDVFDAVEGKPVTVRRVPGYTKIKNNDVVVFHMPHPHSWNKIEMDMSKYSLNGVSEYRAIHYESLTGFISSTPILPND